MGGFWSAFTYFVAGDANNDEAVNIADVVYLINYLFMEDQPPAALPSGDPNCDGAINIADVVYLMNYLFIQGPAPLMCDP
ncbi:MAG: dockerin type I repeat-containing protein [candidate division Zixibacteria bacterium]|nr:dockerin type I repeat-containing protein [candidate division Zixibacteria bacterium]